jgi:hypothetical protein
MCREKTAHFMFSNFFFSSDSRTVCEAMWKDVVQPDIPQMTVRYGACALRGLITKATNTHSRYVILVAFPLQQWLHERS